MSEIRPTENSDKPKSKKVMIIGAVWLFIIGALVFAIFRAQDAAQQRQIALSTQPWDEDLLACNQVENAAPTEAFDTCLRLAEEGWINAALKIAWAYSRDGEHQSWQQVYEWLVWLSDHDEYAQLLSHIVLFEIGESEELKLSGERGIQQMAVVNQPAANAYLAAIYYLELNSLPQRSSVPWLIDRSFNSSEYWIAPEQVALAYARGFLGPENTSKAKDILLSVSEQNFPVYANNAAWFLATTDIQAMRDADKAVQLAEKVVADEQYSQSYIYVDTLAAAYAADQNFEQAVSAQQNALSLLSQAIENGEPVVEDVKTFEARLALFESKQPYTEPAANSGVDFFKNIKNQIEQALIDNLYVEFEAPEPPSIEPQ